MDTDPPDPYLITVEGKETEIKRTVPPHVAFDVIRLLMDEEAAQSRQLSIRGFPQGADLGEFLAEVEATSNTKRIVAAALFLRRQGIATFNRETIRSTFENSGVGRPANLPRDFAAAVIREWIAPEPGRRDLFTLTTAGIEAVNTRFGSPGDE